MIVVRTHAILLPIFSLVLFAFNACDSSSTGDEELVCSNEAVSGVLLPLDVGNYWEFEVRDHKDQLTDSTRLEIVEELKHDQSDSGVRVFGADWYDPSREPSEATRSFWINGKIGMTLSGVVTQHESIFIDMLSDPEPESVSWKRYVFRADDSSAIGIFSVFDSTEYELIATDEMVETPVGTFATYTFRFFAHPGPDVLLGNWVYTHFAPGIGIVARFVFGELRDRNGIYNSKRLLTDYCIMVPG